MQTFLGEIAVYINKEIYKYTPITLNAKFRHFTVDGRFKIEIDLSSIQERPCTIECKLISDNNLKGGIESGQYLALLSFDDDKKRVSIGTIDELEGTECEYLDNGLEIVVQENCNADKILFGVAWMDLRNRDELDYGHACFAADPSYFDWN